MLKKIGWWIIKAVIIFVVIAMVLFLIYFEKIGITL